MSDSLDRRSVWVDSTKTRASKRKETPGGRGLIVPQAEPHDTSRMGCRKPEHEKNLNRKRLLRRNSDSVHVCLLAKSRFRTPKDTRTPV